MSDKASCEIEGDTILVYVGSRVVWEDSLSSYNHKLNHVKLVKANTFADRWNALRETHE